MTILCILLAIKHVRLLSAQLDFFPVLLCRQKVEKTVAILFIELILLTLASCTLAGTKYVFPPEEQVPSSDAY